MISFVSELFPCVQTLWRLSPRTALCYYSVFIKNVLFIETNCYLSLVVRNSGEMRVDVIICRDFPYSAETAEIPPVGLPLT